MKYINTVCGKYSVRFIDGDKIMAVAMINDNDGYGNSGYWFTIGHYASEKTALRQSIKQMAAMGKELAI